MITPFILCSILFVLAMFAAGLFVGRWNGGGRPKFLQWLDNPFSQTLYAVPLAAAILLATHAGFVPDYWVWRGQYVLPLAIDELSIEAQAQFWEYWKWGGAGLHIIITVIALVRGHGHNMDLGSSVKPNVKFEWYELIIRPLHGKIPEYWYDALGLAVSGITYTLAAGAWLASPLLAVSGAVKAPCYMLGRYLWFKFPSVFQRPKWRMDAPTAWGEAFTCAAIWAIWAASICLIIARIW